MKLHTELLELRRQEKRITSHILEKLQDMEDGRGYLKMGYSSLFDYLVRGLGYSEATAYQRQACVRLAREIPEIKQKIDAGSLTISSVTAAYKYIRKTSTDKKRETLEAIANKSARQVRQFFSEPAAPLKIKKTEYANKVHIRLELSHEQNKKIEKLKALKSHKHDMESLFMELIEKELKAFESTQYRPSRSKSPRQVSHRLRNALLKRAEYKCEQPGCRSTHFLQIDHRTPVRRGGTSDPENLQVLCGAHNRLKGARSVQKE